MAQSTILIIEDESDISDTLAYNLQKEGFNVLQTPDGHDGLKRAKQSIPDLIILDLMLPGSDGLQICRQLRADSKTAGIRILMLTARGEETDEVIGFNMGADDYVTKPFKMRPLLHRIKALLRRSEEPASDREFISLHGIEIDRTSYAVKCDGAELDVTPTEFRLLWTLMSQPGRAFSRFELIDTSRGEDANALERTIDVHVRAIRRKLESFADRVETVRGVGYRFARE